MKIGEPMDVYMLLTVGSTTSICSRTEASLLEQTLVRGEIERGEASRITSLPVRTAQRLLNDRVGEGLLASATPKGPVSLRFSRDQSRRTIPTAVSARVVTL